MSPPRVALSAVLAGLLLVSVPTSVAVAHDELIGSTPEDGAMLREAPEELRLTYSGAIAEVGAEVQVTGPDGAVEGDLAIEGFDVVHTLPDDLESGDYEIVWRVTSADGHPISGELGFSLAGAVTAAEPADEDTATAAATPPDGADATVGPEASARTDAPVSEAPGDQGGAGGLPTWAWVAVGVALVALGGVAVTAIRRREP